MTPIWAIALAQEFWGLAGMEEPFPRELRRPIARGLPVTVVYLPRLTLAQAQDWLRENDVACTCSVPDRWLRACLVARAGQGFVFVDGADAEDEQRFSLAHELAHFLKHYWQPRRLACQRLGDQVCEVFDGIRPATPEERLDSLLLRIPVGYHVHLMQRDGRGVILDPATATAEEEADFLAYELLAPSAAVTIQIREHGLTSPAEVARFLRSFFGLPGREAIAYSQLLLPQPPPPAALVRRLRSMK